MSFLTRSFFPRPFLTRLFLARAFHRYQGFAALLAAGVSLPFLACGITGSESPTPEAQFWVGCRAFKDSLTEFNNQSYAAASYQWDFGNGTTSTEATPSVRYADTGTYVVRLVCKNSDGVADEMVDTIRVFLPPPSSMILDVQQVPMGDHDALWATVAATVLRYRGVKVDPCKIVGDYLGSDCCKNPEACGDFATLDQIERAILRFGGLYSEQSQAPLSWESLREQIAQHRPVVAWLRKPGYYYAVMIVGYEADSTIHVLDPRNGYFTAPYAGTTVSLPVQGNAYDWIHSLYCFR